MKRKLEQFEIYEGHKNDEIVGLRIWFNNYDSYSGWIYNKTGCIIGDFADSDSCKIDKFFKDNYEIEINWN